MSTEIPQGAEPNESLLDALCEEYFERHRLSDQQKRILRLYLDGACDKEIAHQLGCAHATVVEHWRRIVAKTQADCKGGVIAKLIAFLRAHDRMQVLLLMVLLPSSCYCLA